jgi:hypothetical protein
MKTGKMAPAGRQPDRDFRYTPHEHEELRSLARKSRERLSRIVVNAKIAPRI